jgi:hypothetical protein
MAPRHLIIRSTAVQLTLNRNAAILSSEDRSNKGYSTPYNTLLQN